MAQHNSDSLESFFQKISHKSSTEFMENDWRKMELILEEERKRRRFILWRRWNYIGALVVLILLTGGLYFYIPSNVYNGKEKLNNSFFEKERPKNSTAPAVNNTGYINQVFLAKEDDGILNMVRNDRGAHSGNVGQQIISTPPITAKSKERDKEALFNLPNNKKIIATNLNNADINQFTSRKNEYFFKNQNREHPNIKKAPLIVYDSFSKIYFSGLTNLSSKEVPDKEIRVDDTTGERIMDKQISNLPQANNSKPNPEKTSFQENANRPINLWSIGAYLGPEISRTTMAKYGSLSSAFSLSVSYNLSKRVSLSTGVTFSNKRFSGKGTDSEPPAGFWLTHTNAVIPDVITGKANYIDISFLIGYRITEHRKSKIRILAGLSNYIITSEYYRFSFKTPNPGAKENWVSNKTAFQPFSAANFSINYSFDFRPEMSLEIAPYIKVPINNSGWANYKINSNGISVGLKYKIPPKNRYQSGN